MHASPGTAARGVDRPFRQPNRALFDSQLDPAVHVSWSRRLHCLNVLARATHQALVGERCQRVVVELRGDGLHAGKQAHEITRATHSARCTWCSAAVTSAVDGVA
jgi:hypothetical protein